MLRTALRNVFAHKARLAVTVLAVCLGVAFVSGTLVFADSTAAAYRAAASKNFADIDVTVTPKEAPEGNRRGPEDQQDRGNVLDDALVRELAAVPGVASVRPSADGSATLTGSDGSPLRAGKSWANLGAGYVPGPDGTDSRYPLAEGRAPRGSGEVAVDRGTAKAGGFTIGDTLTLATDGPVLHKKLVGIVDTRDSRVTAGGTLVLFDKATAQQLYATPGHYGSIDLTATPGTSQPELAARAAAVLPTDRADTTTGRAQADQQGIYVNTMTRGYAKLPLVFAGVSLFIGSFLIVNTFTMLVSRRTREIALLRAVGASRRQVTTSVLAEAALTGLIASVAGFALGLAIATGLPGLLGTAGDALPEGPLEIGPLPVLAAFAVGVGVTVLSAWLPSRRAARIAPVEAMRSAEEQRPAPGASRVRAAVGLAFLLFAAALLLPLGDARDASEANLQNALFGCAGLAAALITLAPLLAGPVIRLTGRLTERLTGALTATLAGAATKRHARTFPDRRAQGTTPEPAGSGLAGRLARENALRDPRRTAATASALMISTALVAGLAVIGHSGSQALDRQATAGLGADYVIGTRTPTTGIAPAAAERVAEVPGVRTAVAVSDATFFTGGGVRTIAGVDPAAVDQVMRLHYLSGSADKLGPGRILLSATLARAQGLTTGGHLNARLGLGGEKDFEKYEVVGVYQDNPVAGDALGARAEVQAATFLPGTAQRILVRTDDGTVSAALATRLRTAVGDNPLLRVQDREQIVREAAGTVGDLLTLMYGLLGLGVVISALGIVNTLAVSVAERTREIGVLRALGMDRSTVRRMIRREAVTVAGFGTAFGLAGGLTGAWAVGSLAHGAIATYTFSLPWGTLLLVCALSLTAGAAASVLPAHRAASLSPLEAVGRG
ncbi:FtsX-like permease family protein [Streptomyces sp. NPDC097619]|uniref:ABC transporter permease n=1 Tax=Streptomyces sp. NPDC097619 TaxID=3157228 RepID=UPI00332BBCC6